MDSIGALSMPAGSLSAVTSPPALNLTDSSGPLHTHTHTLTHTHTDTLTHTYAHTKKIEVALQLLNHCFCFPLIYIFTFEKEDTTCGTIIQ